MSKFAKRIKKLNKKCRNILVVGNAWGNLQELSENFSSVFLIDDQKRVLRAKNIIFRENYSNLNYINDIDIILIDRDHEMHLAELFPVFKRWNSFVLFEGPELISKENQKFLKSHHYQIVDIQKRYYVWKCGG